MNKEIIKRVNDSDIKIVIRGGYVSIEDAWNGFQGRFRLDDMDNFMIWLDHVVNSVRSVDKCLDLGRRFFNFPMEVWGNYIAKERIQYIKDMLENISNSKLYETILDIKDDTKLLKEILNHASLWELDDVYSRIKEKKGELQ